MSAWLRIVHSAVTVILCGAPQHIIRVCHGN
jgi:hypothetical protein